jgi:carboxyl-terminal processing protease
MLLAGTFLAGVAAVPVARRAEPWFGITPARADEQAGQADTYRWLTLFGDVFERVRRDYVDPVSDKTLVQNALDGMLSGLDPHSAYMTPEQFRDMEVQTSGQFGGLGIEVTEDDGLIQVISPIDDTPASRAGIKAGDLITAIDGKTVEGLDLSDAVRKMRGPVNSPITLTIKRQGVDAPVVVTLKREIIHIQVVKDRMEPHDIGYVRLSQFTEGANSGIQDAIAKLKKEGGGKLRGVVLDLRDNPGGLLEQAVAVASDFVNSGEIVSTRGRHADDSQRWDASGHDLIPGVPMVVLINNGSASSSEIVSGALQDHRRAILMGERSFGKGSVQTVIPLPGGGAMRLTTARYYTPSGRSIQDLGIAPDIKVAETYDAQAHFGPAHEWDLNHTITNTGGTHAAPPRPDLPPIAASIPAKPPKDFPKFDPKHPTQTDFQLLQALKVLDAMADEGHHAVAKE